MNVAEIPGMHAPPTTDASRVRSPSFWLLLAIWTVPALLSTFETVMFARLGPRPIELWRAFASEAPGWYAWALFTRGIVWLAFRFPLQRPIRWRSVAVHVAAYLTVAASASVVWAAVSSWLRGGRTPFLMSVWGWFLSGLPFTVMVYAAVVAVAYTVAHRATLREQERDAALLSKQLAEAQLAALRMQLHPHFLFNTLNGIMTLMRDGDTARAVTAVGMLSDLLRTTLRLGSVSEVSLGEELAFARSYLAIEQLRFEDRLRVTYDVPAPLVDLAVPTFVLQPFIENAVRHGILPRRAGGSIAISAALSGADLVMTVQDDGGGLDAKPQGSESGVGINNARATLAQLYGSRAGLDLSPGAHGGVTVTVRLPARRMNGAAAGGTH